MGDQADHRVGPRKRRVSNRGTSGMHGWLNERFSGFIVSPVKDSLVGEVLAWTPSTQRASSPHRPFTSSRPTADAKPSSRRGSQKPPRRQRPDRARGQAHGGAGHARRRRRCVATTRSYGAQYDPVAPTPQGPPPSVVTDARPNTDAAPQCERGGERVSTRCWSPAGPRCGSTTPAASTGRSALSTTGRSISPKTVPTVVLRNEDYGRISRILADGTP